MSPGKYTFDLKRSTTVPITTVNDKRQTIATFTDFVSAFFYLFSLSIMVKQSVVYPNTNSVIALMLHLPQIIGTVSKSVSGSLRKLSFPNLKRRKKNLITQRNDTL